jgi:hypothetical protein
MCAPVRGFDLDREAAPSEVQSRVQKVVVFMLLALPIYLSIAAQNAGNCPVFKNNSLIFTKKTGNSVRPHVSADTEIHCGL